MQGFSWVPIDRNGERVSISDLLDSHLINLMYRMLRNLNMFKKFMLIDGCDSSSKYIDHFNTVFPKHLQEATNRNLDVENIKRNLEAILDENRNLLDYDGYKLPYEPYIKED